MLSEKSQTGRENTSWFYLYEVAKIVKLIEIESGRVWKGGNEK